jgi:hypothetical protein
MKTDTKKYTSSSSQENVSVCDECCLCWKEFKMINKLQTFFLSKNTMDKTGTHTEKGDTDNPHCIKIWIQNMKKCGRFMGKKIKWVKIKYTAWLDT